MQDSALSTQRSKKHLKFFVVPLLIAFILDQITKFFIIENLTPFDPPLEVIGSVLRFKLAFNPYGVFSISFGPAYLYYLLSFVGILFFYIYRFNPGKKNSGSSLWFDCGRCDW